MDELVVAIESLSTREIPLEALHIDLPIWPAHFPTVFQALRIHAPLLRELSVSFKQECTLHRTMMARRAYSEHHF